MFPLQIIYLEIVFKKNIFLTKSHNHFNTFITIPIILYVLQLGEKSRSENFLF